MVARISLAVAFIAFILMACCCGGGAGGPAKEQKEATAEIQAERKAFVEKLTSKGYIQKIDSNRTLPQLWVTPKFMALNFDDKKSFTSAVYAWIHSIPQGGEGDSKQHLDIYHSKTGKKIGSYNPTLGLELD